MESELIFKAPRFAPAVVGALLAGLLLLFLKELSEPVQMYLIPALVIYSLGAALIGTLHRMLAAHYTYVSFQQDQKNLVNNEGPIPVPWKLSLLMLHLMWFAALATYLAWRNVI